jgi:hypothetical protein
MEKTIVLDNKNIKLRSSAVTNIWYKRAFGEDLLVQLTAYAKNYKELQSLQKKITELKEDSTRSKEEILQEMNNLMASEAFITSNKFKDTTLPQMAYIMYLEANEPKETVFHKLNRDEFELWLCSMDQDELFALSGEVMDLWQSGAKTHSKIKN